MSKKTIRSRITSCLPGAIKEPLKRFIENKRKHRKVIESYGTKLINEMEVSDCFSKGIRYLKDLIGAEAIGDYLEFGVCHGSSMTCMFNELKKEGLQNVRLFGFDSFEGLPPNDDPAWKEGAFNSDLKYTKKILTNNGIDWQRVVLTKGWFDNTLNNRFVEQHKIQKASLIMVDCDVYDSTKAVLNFVEPLIKDMSIIIFDDWNPLAKENKGEKKAFEEFLAERPQFAVKEFDEYSYKPGDLNGKVFIITRPK